MGLGQSFDAVISHFSSSPGFLHHSSNCRVPACSSAACDILGIDACHVTYCYLTVVMFCICSMFVIALALWSASQHVLFKRWSHWAQDSLAQKILTGLLQVLLVAFAPLSHNFPRKSSFCTTKINFEHVQIPPVKTYNDHFHIKCIHTS